MSRFFEWFDRVEKDAGQTASGRAFIEAGYKLHATGGGCTAWSKEVLSGLFVLITDSGGTSHEIVDDHGDYWLIGYYGNQVEENEPTHEAKTWAHALKIAEGLVSTKLRKDKS